MKKSQTLSFNELLESDVHDISHVMSTDLVNENVNIATSIDYDRILLEWSYRTKKGYPDLANSEDIHILKEILKENNLSPVNMSIFEDAEVSVDPNTDQLNPVELNRKDVDELANAFNLIKDRYIKYLSIFHYFDPNSLGTISEVLLTKLINSLNNDNIKATHTGASGELTDIIVNGIRISLKTTAESKAISLGSDEERVKKGSVSIAANLLRQELGVPISAGGKYAPIDMTIHELMSSESVSKNLKNLIKSRIDAIVEKLSGKENDEMFVWIEKKLSRDKTIQTLIIHIIDYDKQLVSDELLNSYIYVTDKAWGLVDSNGKQLISPDSSGKALNIVPNFVYKTVDADVLNNGRIGATKQIRIDFPDSASATLGSRRGEVSDKLFNALDDIYTSLTA